MTSFSTRPWRSQRILAAGACSMLERILGPPDGSRLEEAVLSALAAHGRPSLQPILAGSVVAKLLAMTGGPVLVPRTMDRERPSA